MFETLALHLLCKKPIHVQDVELVNTFCPSILPTCCSLYGQACVTQNIHLGCHLKRCVENSAPIMTFWLFSLERYNGLLSEQPNNNECIELQLMRRFLDYYSQANLLIDLVNEESNPIADQFSLLSFTVSVTLTP